MESAEAKPLSVLAEYGLGDLRSLTPAGGTAGRTWKVATSEGDYFVRLRGVRTSGDARLMFDHGLREHLQANGVPTAAAVSTRAGERWVRRPEGVYELYPFVVGRAFRSGREIEIANAARALARFHEVARDYESPLTETEQIAQYTTLGFSEATSVRMDDPELQRANLSSVLELADCADDRRRVEWAIARVEDLINTYGGPTFDLLTGWVIHGDYTPANLLFSDDGEVLGIFDLDWALPGARCRDIADGLYFFASCPREVDSSDIWSLTEAAEFSPSASVAFLRGYHQSLPLSREEIEAIPRAFEARWFSIRLEGMAKVAEEERLRFFSRGVEEPVRWLDENWGALKEQVFGRE